MESGRRKLAAVTLFAAALFLSVERSSPDGTGSPEETLIQFLSAMQNQEFEIAYDLASKAMKGGRSKAEWSARKRELFQMAEAKIFDFALYPASVQGDVAIVPSVTTSQDKFLNQLGVEERELYFLVKEEGAWKVDRQKLVDNSESAKWFTETRRRGAGCSR